MDFDVLTIINLHVYIVLIYSEEKQLSYFASIMCWLKISACLFEIILWRNLLKDERQNLNILSNLVFYNQCMSCLIYCIGNHLYHETDIINNGSSSGENGEYDTANDMN